MQKFKKIKGCKFKGIKTIHFCKYNLGDFVDVGSFGQNIFGIILEKNIKFQTFSIQTSKGLINKYGFEFNRWNITKKSA